MSDTPSDRKPVTDIIYFDFDDEELDAAADAELTPYEDLSQGDDYDDYDDSSYDSDRLPEHTDAEPEDAYPSEAFSNKTQFPGTSAIGSSTLLNDGSDASLYIENLENDAREDAKKQTKKKKTTRTSKRGEDIDPVETEDSVIDTEHRRHPQKAKSREDDLSHPDYTVTITKGLTNTVVKRHYFSYVRYHLTRIFMFLLFVAFITYIAFSVTSMTTAFVTRRELSNQITELKKENSDISSQLAIAEAKVTQLSQAMNATIASSQSEAAKYEDSLLPSGFPLSHFAPMEITFEGADNVSTVAAAGAEAGDGTEEGVDNPDATASDDGTNDNSSETTTTQTDEDATNDSTDDSGEGNTTAATVIEDAPSGNPIALFACNDGTSVIASGGGVVTRITNDDIFGSMLTIDHRNGYITIYRNKGEALVRVGDTVERGDSLFEITEENTGFGYQIKLNDSFINPASMIEING